MQEDVLVWENVSMLLIGDVHINGVMKDRILSSLRSLTQETTESSLVFVGDYVYHFAYDRKSLLELFSFFVELYHQGKDVYVLAGNHDWIQNEFVYKEWQMALSLFWASDSFSWWKKWSLQFITEPCLCDVDGESILFFPYNMLQSCADVWLPEHYDERSYLMISEKSKQLLLSDHKREKHSWTANLLLMKAVLEHQKPWELLTVIHHHYVEWVQFPGERGRFGFKDVALCREWLDISSLRMISGHLHKPFVYKNYLCVWSSRATSPLEVNMVKVSCVYAQWSLEVSPLWVNGHIKKDVSGEDGNTLVDEQSLFSFIEGFWEECQKNMALTYREDSLFIDSSSATWTAWWSEGKQWLWMVSFSDFVQPPLDIFALQLIVPAVNYDEAENLVEKKILDTVSSLRLKKESRNVQELLGKLDLSSKNLKEWFHDWKTILKEYLSLKYGEEEWAYLDLMREMKLL